MNGNKMNLCSKVTRRQISLAATFLLLSCAVTAGGAKPLPQNSDDSASAASAPVSASNIFTPPDGGNQVPMYAESNSPNDRAKRALLGNKKDGIPTFEQIRTIPSLTQPQRKQLREVFGQSKEQLTPLVQQLKDLKEKNGGDVKQAMADPETREKFLDLRRQIQDLRKHTWEQVRGILSDNQLQELDAMRKGELTPATFNPPITDPRQLIQQRRQQMQQMQQNEDGSAPPANDGTVPFRRVHRELQQQQNEMPASNRNDSPDDGSMPAKEQMPASDN